MNYSDKKTETELNKLERKINRAYTKAYAEVKQTAQNYFDGWDEKKGDRIVHHAGLAEREAKLINDLDNGKITLLPNEDRDEYLKQWRMAQAGRGERWYALRDDLANRMVNSNEVASAYINDATPGIYSLNANYQAYEIGKGLQGVSFTMYDEQTVKNLITSDGNFTEFRTVRVNPTRDYEWNSQLIQNALTSSILRGDSIKELSNSFMGVMKRNKTSAIRNARTAFTSAQNGGRLTSLRQARSQGIYVKKEWLSAHDGRVRDSHAMLDGQIRDIDAKFDNGLLYPGDSNGIPAEVYNCRCTLTYIYPDYDDFESSEIYRDNSLEGESYQQFVKRMNNINGATRGNDDAGAYRTIFEQRRVMQNYDNMLNDELVSSGNWSGKIQRVISQKKPNECLPNGDIRLHGDASDVTIIHELVHSHSYLKYGAESFNVYHENFAIEEASTEFYSLEFAMRNGLEVNSVTHEDIDLLRYINKESRLYNNDYDFAKDLISKDLTSRYNWLESKIREADLSEDARDYIYSKIDRVLKEGILWS